MDKVLLSPVGLPPIKPLQIRRGPARAGLMTGPQLPDPQTIGPTVTFPSHELIALRPDPLGTVGTLPASNGDMDDTEGEVIRADGFDPDDPAVVTAIDFVRWQLSMHVDEQLNNAEATRFSVENSPL